MTVMQCHLPPIVQSPAIVLEDTADRSAIKFACTRVDRIHVVIWSAPAVALIFNIFICIFCILQAVRGAQPAYRCYDRATLAVLISPVLVSALGRKLHGRCASNLRPAASTTCIHVLWLTPSPPPPSRVAMHALGPAVLITITASHPHHHPVLFPANAVATPLASHPARMPPGPSLGSTWTTRRTLPGF